MEPRGYVRLQNLGQTTASNPAILLPWRYQLKPASLRDHRRRLVWDFLFEFGHADVASGLIVIERRTLICIETLLEMGIRRIYVRTIANQTLLMLPIYCGALLVHAW